MYQRKSELCPLYLCIVMSGYSCRRGPLQGPELGLLEAEMSRVFGLGYTWPDTYAQCVFQTLLYTLELR